MNAMDIAKIATTSTIKAKLMANFSLSLAINAHMRTKAPVMEKYIAMESQIMKTSKANLCPASEWLKRPGTVKAAEKVTVATSTAITKITLIRF